MLTLSLELVTLLRCHQTLHLTVGFRLEPGAQWKAWLNCGLLARVAVTLSLLGGWGLDTILLSSYSSLLPAPIPANSLNVRISGVTVAPDLRVPDEEELFPGEVDTRHGEV